RLSLEPSACAAVEDSVNGALAACAAGMATYLVPEWAAP
ncbi:HAD family phosphatase, partial [Olsenella uli]|nr:HAD family phosphatase [Olsenella uli]